MNRTRLLIISAVSIAVLALLGVWFLVSPKPTQNDFVHFDNQRKILDKSIESYNYMLEDFSAVYLEEYREKRSDQDKKLVLDQASERFYQEAQLSRDRLGQMEASPVSSNDEVKAKFVEFKKNYESALNFYDARLTANANIISAINGSCAELSKQNFGKTSFPRAYVKTADLCLTDLANAKKNVTQKPALTLLTSVEKLVRERRDKFDEVKADDFEGNAAKIEGILLLVDINFQVKKFQTQYAADSKAEYSSFATKVNNSVTELREVTQKQMSTSGSKTNSRGQ